MADEVSSCLSCHRLNPRPAWVCETCRQRAAELLAELPRLHQLLTIALVPGASRGERACSTGRAEAPLPLNLGAFNLLAAGAIDVHDPTAQVGVLPLDVWLQAWGRDWAARYGAGPVRAQIPQPRPAAQPRGAVMRSLLNRSKLTQRQFAVNRAGETEPRYVTRPISDTLDAEHAARYGRTSDADTIAAVATLATRLDAACDEHPDIAGFLAGLRVMVGACRSVVGEHSDLVHLGRCPEWRHFRGTHVEVEGPCGAALWQDPYVDRIVCPRCRTETPSADWLKLGARIRRAWPATDETHAFAGDLVIVTSAPVRDENGAIVKPAKEVDRYWDARCTCGLWAEQVRGKKIDARGRWAAHRDEATASSDTATG